MIRNYRNRLGRRNRGQTALEYALVVGVISVGVIVVAKTLFVGNGQEPSKAAEVMGLAIDQARKAAAAE